MISRELKATFFTAMSVPLAVTGWGYRTFLSPRRGCVKVHLGPGRSKYLNGWINVDANFITGKVDCIADFRRKLPFRDNIVDAFYSFHVVEHIADIDFHFREMYRCLKPGGAIRVGGPNGDAYIRKFVEGDLDWFPVWPANRKSIGGRLSNILMMRGEHLHILTTSFLKEISENAGFREIKTCSPVFETNIPDMFSSAMATEYESEPTMPHSILIEAVKP